MNDSRKPSPDPTLTLLQVGGVAGALTLPAALFCAALVHVGPGAGNIKLLALWLLFGAVPLGLFGGGFGAGYAEAIALDREWNWSNGAILLGGAFVGGAAASAAVAAATVIVLLTVAGS